MKERGTSNGGGRPRQRRRRGRRHRLIASPSIRLEAWRIRSSALRVAAIHTRAHSHPLTHRHAAHAVDTIAPRDRSTSTTPSSVPSSPARPLRWPPPNPATASTRELRCPNQPTNQPTNQPRPSRGSLHHHAFARRPLAKLPGFLNHGRATADPKQHEQCASTAHKAPQQRVVKRCTTPPPDQSQLRWRAPTASVATPSGRTPCGRTSATPPCQDCAAAQPQQRTQSGEDGSRTYLTRCIPATATADGRRQAAAHAPEEPS